MFHVEQNLIALFKTKKRMFHVEHPFTITK